MTIANYSDLKAAVARWMNRTDLDTQVPDFITIAESRIALTVRSWQMIKSMPLTQIAGQSGVALPTDWLEWNRVALHGQNDPLEYTDYPYFQSLLAQGDIAHCGKYTMDSGMLMVVGLIATGAPSVQIDVSYYARIKPLDDTNNANWLLTAHPEVYLYGAAVSGWQYVLDEQRAAANDGLFAAATAAVNADALKAKLSGSLWRQRPR